MENSTPARKPSKALILSVAALVLFGGGAFAAESAFRAPTVAAGEAIAPTEEKSPLGEQALTPVDITDETESIKSGGANLALPGLSLTEDIVIEGGSGTEEPVLAPAPNKKVSIATAFPSKTYSITPSKTVTPVVKSYSEVEAPVRENTPVADTPASSPVEEAPTVEENPTEEVPSEETPTEDIPSGEVSDGGPVEEAPVVEENPVEEETPTEDTPTEDVPSGEVSDGGPVEEAPPVEETPVEEVPTEEAPVEDAPSGEVSDGGPVAPEPTQEEAPNSGGVVDDAPAYLSIDFSPNTSPEVKAAWAGDYSQIQNFVGNPSSSMSVERVDENTRIVTWGAENYRATATLKSNDVDAFQKSYTEFLNKVLAEMSN